MHTREGPHKHDGPAFAREPSVNAHGSAAAATAGRAARVRRARMSVTTSITGAVSGIIPEVFYKLKGENPKGGFCADVYDVSDMGKLSGKCI